MQPKIAIATDAAEAGNSSREASALEKVMARDIIRTPDAPSPPPTYSQAVRAARSSLSIDVIVRRERRWTTAGATPARELDRSIR